MDDYKKEMEQLAIAYMDEGKAAFFDNKLNDAALLVQNAINLFQEIHNYEKLVLALNLMGVIYGAIGNETSAIDYFLEGLSYAIDYHFYTYTCLFYNNIGSRYQQLGRHEQAIEYFLQAEKALEIVNTGEGNQDLWAMITFLNLSTSYGELDQFALSEKYLDKSAVYMKDDIAKSHKYTFLITQCRLYWCIDKKDFVYKHLDELIESGEKDNNTSDYVQDMLNLCDLLKKMQEYDKWKSLIFCVRNYAKNQNSVYFYMVVTEMWMDYCKTVGDTAKYQKACIEYAELCQKQKEITDMEKAAAIDIKIELREKENQRKLAEQKANNDSLTNLGNRYLMESDIQSAIQKAAETNSPLTIGILDIDCFKQMNDTYGHIQGDKCLKTTADILTASLQGLGRAYRFGGDEFILLLQTSNYETVEGIARNIQKCLHEAHFENINSTVISELTMSQGYSCFIPNKDETPKKAIKHADKVLYEVKESGKNSYKIIIEDS